MEVLKLKSFIVEIFTGVAFPMPGSVSNDREGIIIYIKDKTIAGLKALTFVLLRQRLIRI